MEWGREVHKRTSIRFITENDSEKDKQYADSDGKLQKIKLICVYD